MDRMRLILSFCILGQLLSMSLASGASGPSDSAYSVYRSGMGWASFLWALITWIVYEGFPLGLIPCLRDFSQLSSSISEDTQGIPYDQVTERKLYEIEEYQCPAARRGDTLTLTLTLTVTLTLTLTPNPKSNPLNPSSSPHPNPNPKQVTSSSTGSPRVQGAARPLGLVLSRLLRRIRLPCRRSTHSQGCTQPPAPPTPLPPRSRGPTRHRSARRISWDIRRSKAREGSSLRALSPASTPAPRANPLRLFDAQR